MQLKNQSHQAQRSDEVQAQIDVDLRKFVLMLTRYWQPASIAFSLIAPPAVLFAFVRKADS